MHLRTFLAASAIGLSLACIAGLASAQPVYKWKDAGGVTHFSQTPPPTGTHYSKVRLSSGPEVSSNPAPAATTGASEPDTGAAFAPPASAGTQADNPANRAKLCNQLTANIAALEGKQPVVAAGADGKQTVLSDTARQQQLATAREQHTQYCTGN